MNRIYVEKKNNYGVNSREKKTVYIFQLCFIGYTHITIYLLVINLNSLISKMYSYDIWYHGLL